MSKTPWVEQDPYERERFGKYLNEFCNEMRTLCRSLRAHVDNAEGCVGDRNAKGALESVRNMAKGIEELLPGIEEFGTREITLSKPVQEAQEYKFTHH